MLIFREESSRDLGNYRPLCLMFVLGKLEEAIDYTQILLRKNWHSFYKQKYCLDVLKEFFKCIQNQVSKDET